MAVGKSKTTRSKRNMRRAHDSIQAQSVGQDPLTGETHLRHHMTPDGFYKGVQIVQKAQSHDDEDE